MQEWMTFLCNLGILWCCGAGRSRHLKAAPFLIPAPTLPKKGKKISKSIIAMFVRLSLSAVFNKFGWVQIQEVRAFFGSVMDPDPHGSGTFPWIRIRNHCSESESSKNERANVKKNYL